MTEQTTPANMSEGRVADATRGNWVDRFAPVWSRPWLRLSRADRPVGTWLLLIPCWWGIGLAVASGGSGVSWHDLWIAAGCAIGAVLMRGAGCAWNDLTDREFDAQVARTRSRPLPSGQVTPRGAFVWVVVQSLLAFGILLSFPWPAIWLGIGSLGLVCVYPFAKRFTWWPQVFLGLAFNWGALLAWAAQGAAIGWPPLLLYLGGISWTLFYDTIYAHQDREDDMLIGVKSTARLFGTRTAAWLAAFLAVTVLCLALAVIMAGLDPARMALGLAGVAALGLHLGWQMRGLDIDDADTCLRLFRSNRDAGLLFAGALWIAALT